MSPIVLLMSPSRTPPSAQSVLPSMSQEKREFVDEASQVRTLLLHPEPPSLAPSLPEHRFQNGTGIGFGDRTSHI